MINPRAVSRCSLLLGALILSVAWTSTAAGVQDLEQLSGKHIDIVTDLPLDQDRRAWPAVVDAAIPLWCQFWNVDPDRLQNWRVTAYVMSAKEPFNRRGLIPPEVPDFPHGFQYGNRVFLLNQPSPYYTRHLLLHEVVHALAFYLFGSAGPPWFMEGTAEFLATHRWDGSALQIGIIPDRKESVPYWGRFRMLEQRRQRRSMISLLGVMRFNDMPDRYVEPYAWTWALMQMLMAYPEYQQLVVAAGPAAGGKEPLEFSRDFYQQLAPTTGVAQGRWRVLIDEFDYGYDMPRSRVELQPDDPLWNRAPYEHPIRADRGWQSVGRRFPAAATVQLRAEGETVVAHTTKPWLAYPEGITIRYFRGHPLGRLIGTWLPTSPGNELTVQPLEVFDVGRGTTVTAPAEAWLLLRIAEDSASLRDNEGVLQLTISAAE